MSPASMTNTEAAYDRALGACLDAMVSLRRLHGNDAIESLQFAIRTIEREHQRARREDRLKFAGPIAPPPPFRGE